jgi:hypothetical protein
MGLLDDLKKGLDIAGGTITGVAPGERLTSAIPSGSAIAGIFGGASTLGFGGGFDQLGEEDEDKDKDGLAAMLDMSFATRTQEVNDQLNKARTPEEFLAANQAGLELFALLNQRESLLASGTALTELQQLFDESDDSEIAIGQLDTLLSNVNTLLTPEGQIADSLSDEDQQFQDLLRRGTELDVLLKEQQLAEAQRQQEFAGVFNLLDVLPAKQRADVVAALLETPLGQNLFFGDQGSFSGAPNQGGTPLPSGAQSPGEVFEQAFRGGG